MPSNKAAPLRFKYIINDDVSFNLVVYLDVCKIEGVNILHTVDAATSYQSGHRLLNKTAAAIWSVFHRFWLDSYLGPPYVITHDAGTNFSSREFAPNCDLMHIRLDPVPKEAPRSMTTVERQHASLRRSFLVTSKKSQSTVE